MSPVEVVHFIQSLLSLTPDVASRIETICGGKPKVAVELIAEWIQQGALVSTADGYELREGFGGEYPGFAAGDLDQSLSKIVPSMVTRRAYWLLKLGLYLVQSYLHMSGRSPRRLVLVHVSNS